MTSTHVEVRGQVAGVVLLLPPCRLQRSSCGQQAWCEKAPLCLLSHLTAACVDSVLNDIMEALLTVQVWLTVDKMIVVNICGVFINIFLNL